MDEIIQFLDKYGLLTGILIWLTFREGPNFINWIKERLADDQEHRQDLRVKDAETKRLDTLIAMGSKTFTEEQLTLMTSETQTQLAEANEYIRKEVGGKLDVTIQKLDGIQSRLDKLPETILDDIRSDLRAIADNWKSAMLEYRHIQTKLAIMTSLFQDYYDHSNTDKDENDTSL